MQKEDHFGVSHEPLNMKTYDVFLSFRGPELRRTFLSHLLSSLKIKEMTTFTASESSLESLRAIQDSLVAIPVISKSLDPLESWVDDLTSMIKHERRGTLTAVPLFFGFTPYDISDMLRNAEKKAESLQGFQRMTLENVTRWLDGHVTKKSAFLSTDCKDDSELVSKVTSFVYDALMTSSRSYSLSPVLRPTRSLKLADAFRLDPVIERDEPSLYGDYRFVSSRSSEDLLELLLHKQSSLTGVCGLQGVGKTRLVRHVYDDISPKFHYRFWIRPRDVRSCSRPNSKSLVNGLASSFKEMIRHRKVLLVADGVEDIKQLKGIIKDSSWFGPGSRVIVISHDKSLLTRSGVKLIYELECPSYEEALVFFSEFAFNQRNPPLGFEDLSFRALQVTNRLPLALKLLGSFLCNKEKDEWVSTLRRLQASHSNYTTEVCRYMGAEEYAPRSPMKVDQHVGVQEAPFYRFAL